MKNELSYPKERPAGFVTRAGHLENSDERLVIATLWVEHMLQALR